MKKLIVLLMGLATLLLLAGCSSNVPVEYTPAATSTPILTPVPTKAPSNWTIGYYVDEFGDPTGTPYIMGEFHGTFSNTATNASDLTVLIYYDFYCHSPKVMASGRTGYTTGGYTMCFRLLEYDRTRATYLRSEDMRLKIKVGTDVYEYDLSGMAPNGDLFVDSSLQGNYPIPMIIADRILASKEDVSAYITIGSSKYNFKISNAGFGEVIEKFEKEKYEATK